MSDQEKAVEFVRGLAKLIKDIGLVPDVNGMGISVCNSDTGRYVGMILVEDDRLDYFISEMDESPSVSVIFHEEDTDDT